MNLRRFLFFLFRKQSGERSFIELEELVVTSLNKVIDGLGCSHDYVVVSAGTKVSVRNRSNPTVVIYSAYLDAWNEEQVERLLAAATEKVRTRISNNISRKITASH